jgi:hypothetical protein
MTGRRGTGHRIIPGASAAGAAHSPVIPPVTSQPRNVSGCKRGAAHSPVIPEGAPCRVFGMGAAIRDQVMGDGARGRSRLAWRVRAAAGMTGGHVPVSMCPGPDVTRSRRNQAPT